MNIKKFRNNEKIINIKTNECGQKKSHTQNRVILMIKSMWNDDSSYKIDDPKYNMQPYELIIFHAQK